MKNVSGHIDCDCCRYYRYKVWSHLIFFKSAGEQWICGTCYFCDMVHYVWKNQMRLLMVVICVMYFRLKFCAYRTLQLPSTLFVQAIPTPGQRALPTAQMVWLSVILFAGITWAKSATVSQRVQLCICALVRIHIKLSACLLIVTIDFAQLSGLRSSVF